MADKKLEGEKRGFGRGDKKGGKGKPGDRKKPE